MGRTITAMVTAIIMATPIIAAMICFHGGMAARLVTAPIAAISQAMAMSGTRTFTAPIPITSTIAVIGIIKIIAKMTSHTALTPMVNMVATMCVIVTGRPCAVSMVGEQPLSRQ